MKFTIPKLMRRALLLLIALVFTACGGGGTGGGGNPSGLNIPVGTVSGVTFDGLISKADVCIYDFVTGTKGPLLAKSVSDSVGHYSISLQVESRPILIEITGGSYVEEAGATYQIVLNSAKHKLTALSNYTAGATATAAITTFTHMAAGLAAYEISQGKAIAAAIDDANGRVSTLAGGFNILTTMPAQITDPLNKNSALTNELKYGFLGAAISMWTNNHAPAPFAHVTPYTSIDFAQLLYLDVSADGLLDGKGLDNAGKSVALSFDGTTPLSVDVYRFGIGAGLVQVAASASNQTSITTAQVSTFATSYIEKTDAMFNGVAPTVFVAPTVTIAAPAANSIVNGLLNIAAATNSTVGLAKVELLVGTVLKATATNLTAPTFQIDTTLYGDGPLTFNVVATDLTGKVTTSSVSITINNTKPAVSITAPVANSTATGSLAVSATINSIAALSKVELLVDDVPIATAASLTAPTFSFNTTAYRDGVHTIGVRATSSGGLVSISSVQVTFLNNPPVVTVTSPVTNSWARKTITVTGTVTSQNTLTKVELFIDGAWYATAASLTAPSVTWDTTPAIYGDGPHTVALRATDAEGQATTTTVTLKIDNTPPTATGATIPLSCGVPCKNYAGVVSDNYSGTNGTKVFLSSGEVNPPAIPSAPIQYSDYGIFYDEVLDATGAWYDLAFNWYFNPDPNAMAPLVKTTYFRYRFFDVAGNCSEYSSVFAINAETATPLALVNANACP